MNKNEKDYGFDKFVEEEDAKIAAEKAAKANLEEEILQEEAFKIEPDNFNYSDSIFGESDDESDYEDDEEVLVRKPHKKKRVWPKVIAGLVIAGLVIGGAAFAATSMMQKPSGVTAPEPVVTTVTGQKTWKMVETGGSESSRWYVDGFALIKSAKNDEEATNAAIAFVDDAKTDPVKLAGLAKIFLKEDVDKASLVDSNGYATDKAISLSTDLAIEIARSRITVADAPENGYNSGINNGAATQSDSAGITGDRKAIQITDPDGKSVWILARCGNPVTAAPPVLPPGKTDNPPPVTPPTPTPPEPGKTGNVPDIPGNPPTVVTTPAEETPPVVDTTVPGGGGVVDTPTTPPGDETGVTAPDVEEPPATTPVTTPVEPGVNPDVGDINAPNPDPVNPYQ